MTEVGFLDLVKPYLEVGVLGLAAIFLVLFAILALRRFIEREKELIDNTNKHSNKSDARCDEMFKTVIEQNQQNQLLLQQQLQELTKHIINGVTTHTISAEENSALSEKEVQINACLKRTQQKTNSSRVSLVRFHNGGRDMNGLSFLKMSMTNECPGPGFASIMPDFQNLFRSFFSYWCECLINTGKCYIDNIEILKEKDTTMYEYFLSRNVQAIYGIAIKNNDGSIIGFISIEFIDKSKVDMEQVEHCLHDKKIKIETILTLT